MTVPRGGGEVYERDEAATFPESSLRLRPSRGWARLESVLFWLLVAVVVAGLAIFGALLTGQLVHEQPASGSSPSFSIRVAPRREQVVQGANARYRILLEAPNGSADEIHLSLSGATGHFARNQLRLPASTFLTVTFLTVTTSGKTIPGSYPIRVTARTHNRLARVGVILVVRPR